MEVKRVKCPQCGVILEVKNSKNEAVKNFSCPGCHASLSVTFHKEEIDDSITRLPDRKVEHASLPMLISNTTFLYDFYAGQKNPASGAA